MPRAYGGEQQMGTQQSLFSGNPDPTLRSQDLGRALEITTTSQRAVNEAIGRMEGRTDYTMNPYTGCGYCYAAEFQQDDARRAAWGQWVRIKERAGRWPRRILMPNSGIVTSLPRPWAPGTGPWPPAPLRRLLASSACPPPGLSCRRAAPTSAAIRPGAGLPASRERGSRGLR